MRYAVLADLHGNLPALEAVLDDAASFHPDAILVAGDHANAGPFPRQTLELLRSTGGILIRGNGDDYLVDYAHDHMPPEMKASRQWGAIRWAHGEIRSGGVDLLASLPEHAVLAPPGLPAMRMVHGSPARNNEGILPSTHLPARALFEAARLVPEGVGDGSVEAALAQIDQAVLICGHTHIPWLEERGGHMVINPGSVGAPLTGDPRAQYAILSGVAGRWQVEFRAVEYDRERVRLAYQRSGLLECAPGMARACLDNVMTGLNVAWFFVAYAYRLAQARGAPTHPVVPDDLWDEACRTFDWARYE